MNTIFEEIEKKKSHTSYMRNYFKKNPDKYKEHLERARKYRTTSEYKEKRKQYDRKYVQTHPDSRRESCKKYNKSHPEVHKQTTKTWRKNHPDRYLADALKQTAKCALEVNMNGSQYRYARTRWSNIIKKDGLCGCSIQPLDQKLINSITGIDSIIPQETKAVHAHHILYRNKYPKLQFLVNNGIPLSREIHRQTHMLDRRF